jgi:hypothetical protein
MAAETITVFIDPAQLAALKNNNYSLFLAMKVNGQFTVIWQTRGPVATVGAPSYEYKNTFQVGLPSYQVNYGSVVESGDSAAFQASGLARSIELGQTVALDHMGLFGAPTNDGQPGVIAINNQLQGAPNAALLDNTGNLIFVNVQSGMDIGMATLWPIDTYQLWFGDDQNAGTVIDHNVGNFGIVTFAAVGPDQVVSYNAQGQWQDGPLAQALAAERAVQDQAPLG